MLDCPSEISLRPAIERLIREKASLHDMINGNVRDVIINEMHFEKGALEVYLKHPIFALFAGAIADYFIETGAKNYLETRIWCEKVGFVIVTCQKETGQSPHQCRQAAEKERDAARAQRDALAQYARDLVELIRYAQSVGILRGRRITPKVKAILEKHDKLFLDLHIEGKP